MKALIFAAGLGTRLRPLTDNLPKALAPVAGKTLLYWVMTRLRDAGIREFVINVHHFPDKIIDYVRTEPELSALSVSFSDERELLRDTGGGIRFAEPLLEDPSGLAVRTAASIGSVPCTGNAGLSGGGHFLVHNVDIISDLDIRSFCSGIRPDAISTLLVSDRKTQRYLLFSNEMRLVGWTNVATGEIRTPFRGLDAGKCIMRAFAGIHLLSGRIFGTFGEIDSAPEKFPLYNAAGDIIGSSLKPLGQCFPVMDYYLRAAAEFPIYGKEPAHLTLIDAGKPDTLLQAEKFLTL